MLTNPFSFRTKQTECGEDYRHFISLDIERGSQRRLYLILFPSLSLTLTLSLSHKHSLYLSHFLSQYLRKIFHVFFISCLIIIFFPQNNGRLYELRKSTIYRDFQCHSWYGNFPLVFFFHFFLSNASAQYSTAIIFV